MRAMTNTAGDATGTDTKASAPRWRRITCAVLVVLVCVLAPVSLLAVWTRNTLLDTNQYVDTVGPLAQDSAIQNAVANRVVQALETNVDLEGEIKDALPEKAAFVAPFVARGIENFARDATLRLMESDRFQNLWNEANRRAHTQVVAVLTGEGGDRVSTKNGEVVVRLGPIVETVREQLSKLGIDIFSGSGGDRVSRQLVLFQSEDLTKIQGAVSLLDDIAIWLPILMLVLLVLAIAISPNRRRTILRTAIWIAVGMALVLVIFNVGRTVYLDAVTSAGANRDAAEAAYNQILEFLRLSARTAFVVAVVVAIGAWLAGPGRTATRVRSGVKGLAEGEGAGEQTSLGRFVAHYRTPLRVVIIGVALVVLVVLNAVTPLTVLVIAVVVVLLLLLVEFLARGAPKDDGDAGSGSSPPARQAPMKASTSKRSS
jgi:hypothetical protein